jgi:hypothetical protein
MTDEVKEVLAQADEIANEILATGDLAEVFDKYGITDLRLRILGHEVLRARDDLDGLLAAVRRDLGRARQELRTNGKINELGVLQGNGSRIDVLCASFSLKLERLVDGLAEHLGYG